MAAAASEPAAKKARTEEVPQEELEKDAPAAVGPKVKGTAAFYVCDTTLNVLDSDCNSLLPLTDGGLQYLLAGARANIGLKSGRYMFEAKILETMSPLEDPNAKARVPQPRSQLRVGFSTTETGLFLGFDEDSFGFDSDGNFLCGKTKTAVSEKFTSGEVVAVVLNLDSSSPNAHTISLFKDGVRASPPQALPEQLKGKILYPTLTFKNVSVLYNFGPEPISSLPFKCHMLSNAAQKDAGMRPAPAGPKDGRYEVLFPVCLPDEGGFEWLDTFLKENPTYHELSDRALLKWCEQSGLTRPKGYSPLARSSNDKPEMGMGISAIDDLSVRRVLREVAPIQNRNFVVMEVKGNLNKDERSDLASRWTSFKRVATVVIGEPPPAFKKATQVQMLKLKQETSDAEFRTKQAAEKQKWLLAQKQRKEEQEKRKAAKQQAKLQESMLKKAKYEQAKKDAEAKGEPVPEPPEEDKEEDEDDEPEEPEPMDQDPPKVELTNEEKRVWFVKKPVGDLTLYLLNTTFKSFSMPTKEDGFDEIRYVWQPEQKAAQYMRSWVGERKQTSRVEDLVPGEWFMTKWKEWQKQVGAFHAKQNAHKASESRKIIEANAREAKRKAYEAAKAKAEKDGTELPVRPDDLDVEPEKIVSRAEFAQIDVFGVEDIMDIGGGEPLFSAFNQEDWTMLGLRFELYLMSHAFRKDSKDPDRITVPVDHMTFYYNKYFKKAFNSKTYGCETNEEVFELVRDTVTVTQRGLRAIEALMPEELECNNVFIMLTEEHRRERNRRIDLGDESARLKIGGAVVTSTPAVMPAGALTPGTVVAAGVTAKAAAPMMPALQQPGAILQQLQQTVRPQIPLQQPQWQAMRPGFQNMMGMRPGFQQQVRSFQNWGKGW
eukprot:TRINITY_DN39212_c0_g1_i1.p1 TRINITY_DN39212_c0_g1~~TRINITY_DN39212_c0_g1_i1.p1  ORF type:complete len:900 (+),score=229.97 TRINITY_DN39212_c0_g1_i1:49-2700(+)